MGFQKGQPKVPGSGKKKGRRNKTNLAVKEKAELLGIDPTAVLLFFAAGRWQELGCASAEEITMDHRLKASSELMKYIAPTLKSIEHSGVDGGPIETEVVYDTAWRDTPDSDKEDAPTLPPDTGTASGPSK